MKSPKLIVGYPGKPFQLAEVLYGQFVQEKRANVGVRLGFAYASTSGLDTLIQMLKNVSSWEGASKEWLIGLHHGITEPLALKRIRALNNSSLRLYLGGKTLSYSSIRGGLMFHGKIACVTVGTGSFMEPALFLASSANLTGAALTTKSRNYEAGISLHGETVQRKEYINFHQWWAEIWKESVPATDKLIDQYAHLRDRFLSRNPDTIAGLDSPSLPHLGRAGTLWIEAGAMSGGSRNQVEFSSELASYFGPTNHTRRLLRIHSNGEEWNDRPLSYKVTTFGVEIWRLSLPTKDTGGFDYPGRVIRFRRSKDRRGQYFDIAVADPGRPRHERWRSIAHRFGHLGMTSGQRTYGFN